MLFGRGRFFRFLFAGFFFLMIFGLFSRGSYREGYFDGYRSGQAAQVVVEAEGVDRAVPPQYAPRGYEHGHWYHGPLSFIGGVFKFFFFLFLFGVFMKMMAFGVWKHSKRHHHWHRKDHEPKEKSPEDVEPDIGVA